VEKKTVVESSSKTPNRDRSLKIRTILVATDLSAASMQALDCAISIADRFQADLHLVYAHEDGDEISPTISALPYDLATMRTAPSGEEGRGPASRASLIRPENCHVVSGHAYKKVCAFSQELAADLIVLATRGQTSMARILLGSTAERIVQFAPCPVLITRQRNEPGGTGNAGETSLQFKFTPRRILVPVDFSQCSLAGLKYAALFAKTCGARLILFHALFPPNPMVIDRISVNRSGGPDETRHMNAQLEMEALMQLEFLCGVPCATQIRTGYAIQEICAEIKRADVDLLITSTQGQTGIKHALLGSVAEHVVRYADCPVLVVPSREPKKARPLKRPIYS
jgi:nucleotide-binding universal stress UspA family protein